MNKRRWGVTRRTFDDRHELDDLGHAASGVAGVTERVGGWFAFLRYPVSDAAAQDLINWCQADIARSKRRIEELKREYAALRADQAAGVPALCECLMCLVVDLEFQEDRLADYQERFNNIWVPKFGWRCAVAMYVWHVLRQSRLIDWLIRAFGWCGPL